MQAIRVEPIRVEYTLGSPSGLAANIMLGFLFYEGNKAVTYPSGVHIRQYDVCLTCTRITHL
jgi:hypothetical protein